jgi:hypothetical protein
MLILLCAFRAENHKILLISIISKYINRFPSMEILFDPWNEFHIIFSNIYKILITTLKQLNFQKIQFV